MLTLFFISLKISGDVLSRAGIFCPEPGTFCPQIYKMVFSEPTQALQFRFELNKNYLYDFLVRETEYQSHTVDVQRLAEAVEDEVNLIDLAEASLQVNSIIKKLLPRFLKTYHPC